MSGNYLVRQLSQTDVPRAFPLVQAVHVDVSLDDWQHFAEERLSDGNGGSKSHGIVAVQNVQGYLHGLASYKISADGLIGRTLVCDHFIVLDLLTFEQPCAALMRAVEQIARDANCDHIQFSIPAQNGANRSPLWRSLIEAGYACDSMRFHRVSL